MSEKTIWAIGAAVLLSLAYHALNPPEVYGHSIGRAHCKSVATSSRPVTIAQWRGAYRRCMRKAKRHSAAHRPWSTHLASWYGPGFYGNRTGCGTRYTTRSMIVAHKTWRCGTPLTVCYQQRCASAVVGDRGPYHGARTIDLSGALKTRLRFNGVGYVRIQRRG